MFLILLPTYHLWLGFKKIIFINWLKKSHYVGNYYQTYNSTNFYLQIVHNNFKVPLFFQWCKKQSKTLASCNFDIKHFKTIVYKCFFFQMEIIAVSSWKNLYTYWKTIIYKTLKQLLSSLLYDSWWWIQIVPYTTRNHSPLVILNQYTMWDSHLLHDTTQIWNG